MYDRLPPVRRGTQYFLDSLLSLGVGFRIEGDKVIALGSGVSPVLQAEVDKRAAALIAMLPAEDVAPRASIDNVNNIHIDKPDRMDLIRRGTEGAKREAAKKAAMQKRRKVWA
jgi:hypothetical protein